MTLPQEAAFPQEVATRESGHTDMGVRYERVVQEAKDFYQEVVVDDVPRLKDPKEWTHVYVDVFVSFFSMSYTLGHVAALALPIWLGLKVYASIF